MGAQLTKQRRGCRTTELFWEGQERLPGREVVSSPPVAVPGSVPIRWCCLCGQLGEGRAVDAGGLEPTHPPLPSLFLEEMSSPSGGAQPSRASFRGGCRFGEPFGASFLAWPDLAPCPDLGPHLGACPLGCLVATCGGRQKDLKCRKGPTAKPGEGWWVFFWRLQNAYPLSAAP